MEFSWWAALYANLGAPHPKVSLMVVSLIGALLTGGCWWVIGKDYHRQETLQRAALRSGANSDSALLQKLSEKEGQLATLQGQLEQVGRDLTSSRAENSRLRATVDQRAEQRHQRADLGALIEKANAALSRLRDEKFSPESRQNSAAVTQEIKDWLDANIGPDQGQAFMAAPPWPYVYSGMSSQYGGFYQGLRGRIDFLTKLSDRLSR